MQDGGGVRGPSNAVAGTSMEVQVQDGVTSVQVQVLGSGEFTSFPVTEGNTVSIPVPAEAAGSFMLVLTTGGPPFSGISVPVISLD